MHHRRHIRLTWLSLAWFAAVSGVVAAQDATAWKTGPAFHRQLEGGVGITWSALPLREALSSLSKSTGIAMLLDRRIDPDQPIELSLPEQPLLTILEKVAAAAGADIVTVGSVVYLGPRDAAAKLPTLAAMRRQEAAGHTNETKSRLLRSAALHWEELTEPGQILLELARQLGVSVDNPEQVPHDLFPAANLPPLPWTDRATLVLVGFDLTFEFMSGGRSLRLVPIPNTVALEKTYTPRGLLANIAGQLRQSVPTAKISTSAGKLTVAGTLDEHDKIERLLAGQTVRTTQKVKGGPDQKRYTIPAAKGPAGAVLKKVAEQLGKELKYDPALLPKLKQEIEISVKEVTLDELLETTLKPLGLTYKLTTEALEIIPAP